MVVQVKGKVTNRYCDGVIYTATFYDGSGNLLKNELISCGVDNPDYGYDLKTDSNGIVKIPLKLSNGNHKLYLYSQYNIFNPFTDNIKVFDVLTGNKNIKMYYDDGNVYKVRVLGDDGKPVKAGQKVIFTLDGKKYTKKTDKYGYASFKITANVGYHYIKASYKDFDVANTIKVKSVLKVKTGKVKSHSSKIKLTVKFLAKNKKNKKIKVKFNKKTYVAKTNKKGIAIFKLKTPKKLGAYKTVVCYKKLKEYYEYTKYMSIEKNH